MTVRSSAAAMVLVIACDRGATSESATQDVSKATSDVPPPAVSPPVAAKVAVKSDAPVAARRPVATKPVPPTPAAPRAATFDALVDRLGDGVSSSDAAKDGFAQLKAGAYAKAQPFFALAAQRDRVAWKHPFNLACAAAKNGDDDVARIALVEAIRRGGEKAAAKARSDADLAGVRGEPWFEPVLRGEPWPTPTPAIAKPSSPVAPKPPAPADAGPKKTELPHGETTPLAAAQLDTIVAALAAIHHATPVVRASLQHGDTGWAIYEYSRYEACLGAQAAGETKPKKEKCRSRKEYDGKSGSIECTEQWLARMSSLAPPTIAARIELPVGCALHDVRRLDVLDIDADGQDEILIDVVGAKTSAGFRDTENVKHSRKVRVLRRDGSEQLAFDVALTQVDLTPDEVVAKRFELSDENGDGHPDMRVWTRRVYNDDLGLDDEMWSAGAASETMGEIRIATRRYDPATDVWKKK